MFSKEKLVSVSCLALMAIPLMAKPLLVVEEQLPTKEHANNYIYVEPKVKPQAPEQTSKLEQQTKHSTLKDVRNK